MNQESNFPKNWLDLELEEQGTQPSYERSSRSKALVLSRMSGIFVCSILIVLCGLPFTFGLGYYGYLQIFERVIPGVHVGNSNLTWMQIGQAAIELNTEWNLGKKIDITDGFQTWQIYPHDLGLAMDGYRTAERAYEVGRFNSIWVEVEEILMCMLRGCQVNPIINFDPVAAKSGLERLDQVVAKPPENATFIEKDGQLVAIPGRLGYEINHEATMKVLMKNPELIMISGYFKVTLQPVVPAVNDVSELLAEAEEILKEGMTIRLYDAIYDQKLDLTVDRNILATWLVPQQTNEPHKFSLDPTKITQYLNQQSENLGKDRWLDGEANASYIVEAFNQGTQPVVIVNHKSGLYQVEKGDTLLRISWKLGFPMWKLVETNPDLDPNRLYAGQVLTVPSKDVMLPLPVIPNKRIIIDISNQRLMVYDDGKQIRKFIISTGIDKSPTQPGVFQVITHKKNAYASVWDLHMPNFLGIYEAWPGFMNGIHGLPTLSNGTQLWASILGKPASFGCIILDLPDARELYDWAQNGVVVEIRE